MTNMTLAIPEDLKKIMKKYDTIKWSEIARKAMWDQAHKLQLMDALTAKSELTEEDALEIGRKIRHGIAKRHGLIK